MSSAFVHSLRPKIFPIKRSAQGNYPLSLQFLRFFLHQFQTQQQQEGGGESNLNRRLAEEMGRMQKREFHVAAKYQAYYNGKIEEHFMQENGLPVGDGQLTPAQLQACGDFASDAFWALQATEDLWQLYCFDLLLSCAS